MAHNIDRKTLSPDTLAINTIASILNEAKEWSYDDFDAIAAVLNVVRSDRPSERYPGTTDWTPDSPVFEWRNGRYNLSPIDNFKEDDKNGGMGGG